MKALYQIAGLSKQAFHKYVLRQNIKEDKTAFYIQLIEQARSMHPVIGLEKVYYLFDPQGIGRDAFINIGTLAGYALDKPVKLTYKTSTPPYINLLKDKQFNDINQVWATDITYYKIGQEYFYISMILDLYSRKIVTYGVSDSLKAIYSLKVLKMALKNRYLSKTHQLIHHSDKGIQYTSHIYTNLLKKKKIAISMCSSVYENTMMERLNGIIKNSYLIHWNPKSFNELKRLLKKAVNNYNQCPHRKLNMLSPNQFEQQLLNVPLCQRTPLVIFTFSNKKSKKSDPNQLTLFHNLDLIH